MKKHVFGFLAMALGAVTLAACGEHGGARPAAPGAQPTATQPVAAQPATAQPAASTTASASAKPPSPEPSRTAAAPQREATLSGDSHLTVKRFVIAKGVKNREPVAPTTTFKGEPQKIYAFVEVENKDRSPAEIVVEFEPPGGGAPHGDVKLAVGAAPRWRTWAYTRTASTAGSWTAVIKNKKGDVLARAPFEVAL
jgi:hypothetical protein